MFDRSLPGPEELNSVSDTELVSAISGWATAAAAAEARSYAAIAELIRRRGTGRHPDWACDDWDATAAEVSAALTIGHGRASTTMDLALTVRDRLPNVGALFLAGRIPTRLITVIAERTMLIRDPDALAAIDRLVADAATGWGPLTHYAVRQAVDLWVEQIDPDALRRVRDRVHNREFTVGHRDDATGTTSVWGRLLATDAAVLDERLSTMARSVCEDDPRSLAQRRADAIGALAAGSTHLSCRCAAPDCPHASDDGRASSMVIHIVGGAAALTGQPAAVIAGGSVVPTVLLAELVAHGAKVRVVTAPGADAEPRYRPSTALDEFVRMRDLTCRFPGCDRPAVHADLDHTVPYPAGATHPADLKAYCRKHHLIKTFWPGFSDRQQPDGNITMTTPAGRTYTTKPLSRLLFPGWDTTTAAAPPPGPTTPTGAGRALMMPTRKHTRAVAREHRINAERAVNNAERNIPPPF